MLDCPICKTRHSEDPTFCENNRRVDIQRRLAKTFERLDKEWGNESDVRLMIANYTFGYMGVSFGLHTN